MEISGGLSGLPWTVAGFHNGLGFSRAVFERNIG
jgi:hypothetical protein